MANRMKSVPGNIKRGERGQILIMVLILLMAGTLVITPLLSYMGTGIKTGDLFQEKTDELYAADAGIEDGVWQIKYEQLGILFPDYSSYDYTTEGWTYTLPEQVNTQDTSVTISNVWIPSNLPAPTSSSLAEQVISGIDGDPPKLIIQGSVIAVSTYQIRITWYPGLNEDPVIKTLGVWLPAGFTYVEGSSNLEADISKPYYAVPVVSPHAGGQAVIWTFLPNTKFAGSIIPPVALPFPGVIRENTPMVSTITFQFDGPLARSPDAISWVDTNLEIPEAGGIGYTWDADYKVNKIVSVAGDTEVEAYITKNEIRKLSSTISGDYFAAGNSIIGGNLNPYGQNPPPNLHTQLYNSTETTINTDSNPSSGIPANATIAAAYLYWTGWIDWHGYDPDSTIFYDDCSDFDNWVRSEAESVTSGNTGWLNPSSNSADTGGDNNGFESNPTRAYVNGGSPGYASNNDGAGDRHRFYGYDTSDIPADASIAGIEVRLDWWLDSTSGTSSLDVQLSWDGGNTWTSSKNAANERTSDGNPTNTLGGMADTWGRTWSLSDLSSGNFRVRVTCNSSSSSRDFRLDWIPVRITYTTPVTVVDSLWTVSSGTFRGQGGGTSPARTLTLASTLDLSAYSGLTISWRQRETGSISSTQGLRFAFYNEATGWSSNEVAFNNDIGDSFVDFSYNIPSQYLTDDFKIRFLWDVTDSGDYVFIDDIAITLFASLMYPENPTPGNLQTLVEDTARVNKALFNDTPVIADAYQTLYPDAFEGSETYEGTWYYTAMKDVTALLGQWVEDGDIESNGTGDYTFGHYYVGTDPNADNYRVNVNDPSYSLNFYGGGGSTGYPLGTPALDTSTRYTAAHCGWSLLIIYTSPDTYGHQLYLYDILTPNYDFFFGWHNNTDFDNDGNPGGTIYGFLVPDRIGSEWLAGRITVFVGEGDAGYTGDYLRVNGTNMSNGNSPSSNVWNSDSPGLSVPGVDIDTFDISWVSGILEAGDTSAQIDIPTDVDGFTMVYMIFSFRSETVVGGFLSYLIR